ncbi:MAG: sensor domain-containing diguanylate cyclase [Woeseiaceae bacterium]
MIKPPTPVDELLRLETLRNLKILDTDSEERFDRVTRLAKRIFGVPIALVSLVDADRQWFKSRQGLDASETPREVSFCGHAILNDETMVVKDAHEDERFSDNPLVTEEPSIRFYAGCPLSAPDGSKVGTLCVIDREPREMTEEDLGLLNELAQMVEEEFVVEEMMRNDPVTGLSNREGFSIIAEHILAMCERTNAPASLVLLHFVNQQSIAETMGSEENDRAIIELTQLLLASFRNSDIVARLSADAFVVLLAGSRLEDVYTPRGRFMERIVDRNTQTDADYDIEIDAFAIEYQNERHHDVDTLVREVEARMMGGDLSRRDDEPNSASKTGSG